MDYSELALKKHYEWAGKIELIPKMKLKNKEDLSLAYTPGVAGPCLAIQDTPGESYLLTGRHNLVAVITDGSAVLGLGDIGPLASMPVMEGKCVLFKTFGDIDAVPLCVATQDVDEFVRAVEVISGSFGGINLEDISAPRCFEIERRLKKCCEIPVFHDDQHGTAVVALAALMGAFEIVGKDFKSARAVISGAGAAGIAITKLLNYFGLHDLILCDSIGAVYDGRGGLNPEKSEVARITNPEKLSGSLERAIAGADVFIGVSVSGVLNAKMIRSMARDAIIFPMANPDPEIMPDEAYSAGAAVVGTGRSDFPNQINNVLAFPGIFRGALDTRAFDINDQMKIAAARALADLSRPNLSPDHIIPEPFDPRVVPAVAKAVAQAAVETGVARIQGDLE